MAPSVKRRDGCTDHGAGWSWHWCRNGVGCDETVSCDSSRWLRYWHWCYRRWYRSWLRRLAELQAALAVLLAGIMRVAFGLASSVNQDGELVVCAGAGSSIGSGRRCCRCSWCGRPRLHGVLAVDWCDWLRRWRAGLFAFCVLSSSLRCLSTNRVIRHSWIWRRSAGCIG